MPQSEKSPQEESPQEEEGGALEHAPASESTGSGKGHDKPPMPRIVAQMMAEMTQVRSGPAPDVFLEKLTEKHIDKLLDNSHSGDTEKGRLSFALVLGGMLLIPLLCWMFLAYEQPQYVASVIALIVGAVGGFGAGYGAARKS